MLVCVYIYMTSYIVSVILIKYRNIDKVQKHRSDTLGYISWTAELHYK